MKGCPLYEANLHKILGLIWLSKNEILKAFKSFKDSKRLFQQAGSKHGLAISYFMIGFEYRNKVNEFIINTKEDEIYAKAMKSLNKALVLFGELNHIIGRALSH